MTLDSAGDSPGSSGPPLACSWASIGLRAAEVHVAGELDLSTGPQLAHALQESTKAASLTLVVMRELTFMDAAGLRVLLDAVDDVRRAGRRLVLGPLHPNVARLFDLLDVYDAFDLLASPPAEAAHIETLAKPGAEMPPRNPVNAAIVAARTMAVPDRRLWMQTEAGAIRHAWAPAPLDELAHAGRPVELYVDHQGAVNGWRDVISGLAINQRRFDESTGPLVGTPMRCQGPCGLTWQAPAPAAMIEHDEHCLTCAGPLAAG